MREFHILVGNKEHEEFKTKCLADDITMSQMIRRLIRLYLKGEIK